MVSLPAELVYEILKLAAHDARESGKGLLNLTLVSHYMNNWIRSLALRFLIVTQYKGYAMDLKAIHTLPPLCLEQNVEILWLILVLPDSDAQLALERCTNIKSLSYWSSFLNSTARILSLVQALPFLSRLSVRFGFFVELCKEPHLSQFVHSLREIALLDGLESEVSDEIPNFSAFPNLTHFVVISTDSFNRRISSMINAMLNITLCEIVILEGSFSSKEIDDASYATDPRFFYRAGSLEDFFHRWANLDKDDWKEFWNRTTD